MRWLIALFFLALVLTFSFRARTTTPATDAPQAEKVEVVVIPTQAAAKSPMPPVETMMKSLEISKEILREKGQLTSELEANPHATPPAVMKAGLVLGEIAEMEARYPERKDEFVRYYKECFENSETITITRVQCFKRYVRSTNLDESRTASMLAGLPSSVQRLYRRSEAMQ